MIAKDIYFGLQNFLFVDDDADSDVDYEYTSFVTKDGLTLIIKSAKDGTSSRYFLQSGNYNIIWADRENKTYVIPSALPEVP